MRTLYRISEVCGVVCSTVWSVAEAVAGGHAVAAFACYAAGAIHLVWCSSRK